jgi:hypothetical protein
MVTGTAPSVDGSGSVGSESVDPSVPVVTGVPVVPVVTGVPVVLVVPVVPVVGDSSENKQVSLILSLQVRHAFVIVSN